MEAIIDQFPLVSLFLITLVILLLSIEGGIWIGHWRSTYAKSGTQLNVTTIVGAILAMFGFLLAFTYSFSASKFDERRKLVVEEANAIETTYLRAGYLPDDFRDKVRHDLQSYIDLRVKLPSEHQTKETIAKSNALQDQLWTQGVAIAKQEPNSEMAALFIESLNNMIEIQSNRILVGLRTRIPIIIWGVLYLIAILAMGLVGYQAGLAKSRSMIVNVILASIISIILALNADLDRPAEGFLQVSQQAFVDLKEKIGSMKS